MTRKRRKFSKEFKLETVKLVKEGPRSVGEVARDLELTESAVRNWVRQFDVDAGVRVGVVRAGEGRRLLVNIKASHTASRGTYGSPRVHRDLVEDGEAVGRHRVARLMRQEGLRSKRRRRYRVTTHSDHHHPVAANVLERDFTADAENCKWAADITYVWTRCGWLYLAVVLDLCTRAGWSDGRCRIASPGNSR